MTSVIDDKYNWLHVNGYNRGQSTSPKTLSSDGIVGTFHHYQSGSINQHPHTGAFAVYGVILAKYLSIDTECSVIRNLTIAETEMTDGSERVAIESLLISHLIVR